MPQRQNLIEAQQISVEFAGQPTPLFSGIDMFLTTGVQALIGRNGIGKSCLGAVLAKKRLPNAGRVQHFCRVGYLKQNDDTPPGRVADMLGIAAVQAADARILAGQGSSADLDFMADKWSWKSEIAALLAEGGFTAEVLTRDMASLSGGEQTRVKLLALKYQGYEFLILDEPSNHLDAAGRQWLSDWLTAFSGGVLLITHDCVLLKKVALIYELSAMGLAQCQGGWQSWQESREQLRLGLWREAIRAKKQRQQLAREQQRARERTEQRQSRGKAKRADSNQSKIILNAEKGRSQATQSRQSKCYDERLRQAANRLRQAEAQVEQIVPQAIMTAQPQVVNNPLLCLASVILPFGTSKPLSLTLNRGGRLAVTGHNGCGKSTLLRVMNGQIAAKSGQVFITPSHRLMDQHLTFLNQEQSALANFQRLAAGWQEDNYRTVLAQFGLCGDATLKPLTALSGGEQLKVALACLFSGPSAPALLLLDEPDNHLDIESKALLQQALHEYRGALILVSHDSDFIEAIGDMDYLSLSS